VNPAAGARRPAAAAAGANRFLRTAALFLAAGCPGLAAQAGTLRLCEPELPLSATEQDKLFRFGAVIKDELDRSGQRLALVSRSGLDLSRFGMRYSHAGISLQAGRDTPWSVRQLYYACDERKPWLYDQGMASFLLGTRDPALGFVSVVFLPAGPAAALEDTVRDDRRALALLGTSYSANAYAFGLRHQNCNQWVAEMLASAWGAVDDTPGAEGDPPRARAQRWLAAQGYRPSRFDIGARPLMWLGTFFIPWLHGDDHPADDLSRATYRVSMPASLEAFVHARLPEAARIEFCHTREHIVVRRGWGAPLPGTCEAEAGDTVIPFDDDRTAGTASS
jgi:hypothetical protein